MNSKALVLDELIDFNPSNEEKSSNVLYLLFPFENSEKMVHFDIILYFLEIKSKKIKSMLCAHNFAVCILKKRLKFLFDLKSKYLYCYYKYIQCYSVRLSQWICPWYAYNRIKCNRTLQWVCIRLFITSVVGISFFSLVFLLFIFFSISHCCSINKNGTRTLLCTFKRSSLFNLLNGKFSRTHALQLNTQFNHSQYEGMEFFRKMFVLHFHHCVCVLAYIMHSIALHCISLTLNIISWIGKYSI